MLEYIKEFWWALIFLAIALALLVFVLVTGLNPTGFNTAEWIINPANPASPLSQIMP